MLHRQHKASIEHAHAGVDQNALATGGQKVSIAKRLEKRNCVRKAIMREDGHHRESAIDLLVLVSDSDAARGETSGHRCIRA